MNALDQPVYPSEQGETLEGTWNSTYTPGLTLRIHAAIALKVPFSGIAELDDMICESLRNECRARGCNKSRTQQDGPINDGWQITVAHGHSGYGVYAHMEDYPEEGAVLVHAIEQQKPVVWMYQDKSTHEVRFQKHMRDFVDHSKTSEVPLYGEPFPNHELQCVCGAVWCGDEMVHLPNKTAPQREWQGLTQQDIDIAFDDTQEGGGFNEFARAIEAKLKEKNT